jgi:D-amino-acid dehydrogenase
MPRLPVYSNKRAFVCTPLEHGLRIAGTVELGGLEAPPDWRRADVLMTHAKRWLPGLQDRETSRWMGHRPSLPDSVPVISGSPHHRNAFFAFGHGHCGLGLGARTGKLVADLVAKRDPGIDMAPFRIDRF